MERNEFIDIISIVSHMANVDGQMHPEEKKVIIEGEEFCEDVFDPFVRRGDSVSSDEIHTKTYCPVRA